MGKARKDAPNYASMPQAEVPQSRNGKHRRVVTMILSDLENLPAGQALKVPLKSLQDSKENVRSALNRETRKRRIAVHTAADQNFLYIWQS